MAARQTVERTIGAPAMPGDAAVTEAAVRTAATTPADTRATPAPTGSPRYATRPDG